MSSLLLAGAVAVGAFSLAMIPKLAAVRKGLIIGGSLMALAVGASGAVGYNSPGTCSHIRTILGQEDGKCTTGWYFLGWGRAIEWPHYITVANMSNAVGNDVQMSGPREIRLADNWKGQATQSTRFAIPQSREEFIKMATVFREGPHVMINTSLRPAVNASLDSVANMFNMEGYYAGGQRDAFKTEFEQAIKEGRAEVYQRVEQVSVSRSAGGQRAGSTPGTADEAELGGDEVQRVFTEKRKDADGKDIRVKHDYMTHGVRVDSAIFEGIEPDHVFETRIQERKEAASRRVIAREQRLEQEEQRLLAIQAGETEIAKRQAEARVKQIGETTEAETSKMLALIENQRQLEAARLAYQTAEVTRDTAAVQAEAQKTLADATAYEKRVVLEADGALAQKLAAVVDIHAVWAKAASTMNVPATVIGGGDKVGSTVSSADALMQMLSVKTARDLALDTSIPR